MGKEAEPGEDREATEPAGSTCSYHKAETIFPPPRLSRVESEKGDPKYKTGCMKHHTYCLLHLGGDSKYDVFLPSSTGFWVGTSIPQQRRSPLLPPHPGYYIHTPRHRCAPFGLLFGTVLGITPWIPAHPALLHTSPVKPTLSPSTTEPHLPQLVVISAAHAASQTRGRVPLESGTLNKRGLLLFHQRDCDAQPQNCLCQYPPPPPGDGHAHDGEGRLGGGAGGPALIPSLAHRPRGALPT